MQRINRIIGLKSDSSTMIGSITASESEFYCPPCSKKLEDKGDESVDAGGEMVDRIDAGRRGDRLYLLK